MAIIRETRKIDASKVRGICIKQEWYTNGTSADYTAMLMMAEQSDGSADSIYEIAKDIFNNSDMSRYSSDHTDHDIIENIMFYIVNDAAYTDLQIIR